MKSFTIGRNLYGSWTKNTATANLSLGDQVANDQYRKICAMKSWPFLIRTRTLLTTANTQFKALPYDMSQVGEVTVQISTTTYTPREAPSREFWDRLNLTPFTSDIPQWYYIFNGQIGLWPKPASSNNTISINGKVKVIDLSAADYTTGTIVSVASGGTTVVGSGTSWTAQMTGRWIRISYADTANTGDGQWYEIASVTNTTTLELVRAYGGTAIAAGSASYNIGQMPLLPEDFHDMPWKYAAASYWLKENDQRGTEFKNQYEEDIKLLSMAWSTPGTDMVVDDGTEKQPINPNLTIRI